MAEKILQHKHCSVCGKAVPVDEEFCGSGCKEKMEGIVKKKRLWMYIFYGLMAALIVMMFIPGIL